MKLIQRLFGAKPLDIARRELIASQSQLMTVRSDLELVEAQESLLVKRIARLESFMDDAVRIAPSFEEVRHGNFAQGVD
jgi:hypothetical protein